MKKRRRMGECWEDCFKMNNKGKIALSEIMKKTYEFKGVVFK
jgi:hypothetical protein